MQKSIKVIISGGGSGGHIYPAIAIAESLQKRIEDIDILFVGAEGKMEMEKVPQAGYQIVGLPIRGLHRKLTLKNVSFPFRLIWSLIKAYKLIKSWKPDVVIGVGGYASGPILEMGSRLGVPSVIQEQNSYPGITNKLLAKKVSKICVSYPHMDTYFPKDKIRFTGNPLRGQIKSSIFTKVEAAQHFGLSAKRKTILLVGGSLGAKSMNKALLDNTDWIRSNTDIQWIWQIGKLYIEEYKQTELAQMEHVKPLAFIDRMDLAYTMADLVVCRAGALTISEIALLGKPAVFVPSPNVAEDHQTKNAMALVEKESAVLIKDKMFSQELSTVIPDLINDETRLDELSKNIEYFAKPKAAEEVVEEIVKLLDFEE